MQYDSDRQPRWRGAAPLVWRARERPAEVAEIKEQNSIISLVTALFGVVFGILALADNPLLAYLNQVLVQVLGAVAVLA